MATGGTTWTGVLEVFWGPFEGAVGKARELRYDDICDALGSTLERYLSASAGKLVERPAQPAPTGGSCSGSAASDPSSAARSSPIAITNFTIFNADLPAVVCCAASASLLLSAQ